MIFAEKVEAKGRNWIKVSFQRNSKFISRMNQVKDVLYNPYTGFWAVPYEYVDDFEEKMGDFLIIWRGEHNEIGGIPEESIPSDPIVPGYKVVYGPDGSIISSEGFKTQPWGEFQVKGFNALVSNDFLILADDPGLGKSWMIVNAIEARKKLGQIKNSIVLCKATLLYNWREQILEHSNLVPLVVADTPHRRSKLYNYLTYNDDWDIIIISYETYREDIAGIQMLDNLKGIDLCVIDEAHKAKNPTSRIGNILHFVPYKIRYAVTATPLPNTPLESYNYLRWGRKIDMNWWQFRKKYAIFGGYNNKEIVGYQNIRELQSLIQRNMLRRRKKDKLKELPEVTFKTIPVKLTKQQELLYNAVKKEILDDLTDTTLQQIPSALTKLLRLQQITDSPELIGSKSKSGKLEALDDLLEDLIDQGNEKVIVYSKFKEMVDIMMERYKKYNPAVVHGDVDANGISMRAAELRLRREIPNFLNLPLEERRALLLEMTLSDRQKEVYKFQRDDTCKLFIGTSSACREGLTLTAATHVIFMDCEWSWDYIDQAFSRAHRIGQKNAITVYFLVCENTIDVYVLETVNEKREIVNAVLQGENNNKTRKAREFVASMVGQRLTS